MLLKIIITLEIVTNMIIMAPLSAFISIICDTNDEGSIRSVTQLPIARNDYNDDDDKICDDDDTDN